MENNGKRYSHASLAALSGNPLALRLAAKYAPVHSKKYVSPLLVAAVTKNWRIVEECGRLGMVADSTLYDLRDYTYLTDETGHIFDEGTVLHICGYLNSLSERAFELMVAIAEDVDAPNQSGESVLLALSRTGRERLVKICLRAGADPDFADSEGFTPLDNALRWRKYSVALVLARAGGSTSGPLPKSTPKWFSPYLERRAPLLALL